MATYSTMPNITPYTAPHLQPGSGVYQGGQYQQKAGQQAQQAQNLLTQAGPQFEELMQTMTGAYGARGSRGARASQEAALMSGFSPLEASAAAEDQLNQAMQAYYNMVPQMRFQYLSQMAPMWGQLANLYSGLGQQELQSQALSQEMMQGQQMMQQAQQPSPMEQALAQARQATMQRMFERREGMGGTPGGRGISMDYQPLGRVTGAGGGGGGLLGGSTYPSAAGGFLAPMQPGPEGSVYEQIRERGPLPWQQGSVSQQIQDRPQQQLTQRQATEQRAFAPGGGRGTRPVQGDQKEYVNWLLKLFGLGG